MNEESSNFNDNHFCLSQVTSSFSDLVSLRKDWSDYTNVEWKLKVDYSDDEDLSECVQPSEVTPPSESKRCPKTRRGRKKNKSDLDGKKILFF